MAAIAVRDLVVSYGKVIAVDHLSFSAEAGEVLVMLGRNGAGKTSTIEAIEGLRQKTSGEIRILGDDPLTSPVVANRVGVMLQQGGPYPTLSPVRALRLEASYYEHPLDGDSLIDQLGLRTVAGTPAKRLSGGEHRRLSLALALIGDPDVLILDEPTAGVDPHGRVAIRQLIMDLRERGKSIVLTTHELDEAERIASRIIIVDHGQIVATGSAAELTGRSEEIFVRGESGVDLGKLSRLINAPIAESTPGRYRISATPTSTILAAVATYFAEHNHGLIEIGSGKTTLENLFLELTAPPDEQAEQ